jgi:hypothetical protein
MNAIVRSERRFGLNKTAEQRGCPGSSLRQFDRGSFSSFSSSGAYSRLALRKRSELAMTLTDESAMAAAATTGDSNKPKNG